MNIIIIRNRIKHNKHKRKHKHTHLGRVPDGVEDVGHRAHRLGLAAHLHDAARVVRDRPEDVHRQDVRRGGEHAHRGDRGAEEPVRAALDEAGRVAEPEGGDERERHDEHRGARRLEADRDAGDHVRRVPGERGLGDAAHGRVLRGWLGGEVVVGSG